MMETEKDLLSGGTRIRRASRQIPLAAACLLIGSCTVGPDFVAPKSDVAAYDSETSHLAIAGSPEPEQHFTSGKAVSDQWWRQLGSPRLDDILRQAVAGSHDLQAVRASLAEAQESLVAAQGGRYPRLDANATAQRKKLNFAALSGISSFPNTMFNLFSLEGDLSIPLDIFGATARGIEQQAALAEYQRFQLDAAYLTLTGNAVSQILQIAETRGEIKTVEDIIADDRENLDLVNKELRLGAVSQIDVEVANSQLAADRTLLPPLYQQLKVAQHALSVLSGQSPGDWTSPDFDLADFTLPQELPLSLPSELVHRRPDVLAAEAQLHAASAEIGVATAQLYPSISISASLTQAALAPHQFFSNQSNSWSFGPSITAPLFHGGELQARKRAAVDAYQGSMARYEQTVLRSFGQVADLLQALEHDAQLLDDERQAIDAADSSRRLLKIAYTAGSVGVLQVLDAERQYEQARLGYIRATASRYVDTVRLFIAMGGGVQEWDALARNDTAARVVAAGP